MEASTSESDYLFPELDYSKILHFGALVYITSYVESASSDVLLNGDGFITKNLSIVPSNSFAFTDFSGSLFKIVPSYSFAVQKELATQIEESKDSASYAKKKTPGTQQELLNELDQEISMNEKHYNKSKGMPVNFGDSFQFEHVKSHKFLSFQSENSGSLNPSDNFNVELDDHPSEFSHFKILPCYRYQNERNKFIQFDDELYIATSWDETMKDSYLVFQKKFSASQNPDEGSELEDNQDEAEIESQFNNELSISTEKSTKYKLRFYSSFEQRSQSSILFGDIIWISLIERKSHLQFDLESNNVTAHNTQKTKDLVAAISIEDSKNKTLEKHFEILQKRNRGLHFEEFQDKQSKNTIGMWQIEAENRSKGGFLMWDAKVRLRHLSSGIYLAMKQMPANTKEGGVDAKGKRFLLTMERRVTEDSLFVIKNKGAENNNLIGPDSFFHLVHHKTGLSFGMHHDNFMKAGNLNEKVLWRTSVHSQASQENMMRFLKAEPQEVWETRFLLSCLPILRAGIKLVEKMNEETLKSSVYVLTFMRKSSLDLLKECLESVLDFCYYDSNFFTDLTTEYIVRKPNSYRQKMLKEQGFLELLSLLISKAFPHISVLNKLLMSKTEVKTEEKKYLAKAFTSKLVARKSFWTATQKSNNEKEKEVLELFSQICSICFGLISKICQENYENQVECFRFFHLLKKMIGFGLGATNSLLSVFSNNEKLLHLIHGSDDFIGVNMSKLTKFFVHSPTKLALPKFGAQEEGSNHSIVTYFISKFQRLALKSFDYWIEVLDFLTALCKFNDHGVNVNQMMISEAFLQGPGAMYFLQIELLKVENKLQVSIKQAGKELKYELIELFDIIVSTNSVELSSIGAYLKKQLQLLSYLCYGRNYVNIKIMKKTFKMQVLMEYIWNEKLPEDFRAIFVSLLLNIHIDIKPRTERLVPQLSKKLLRKANEEKKAAQTFIDLQNSLIKNLGGKNEENKAEGGGLGGLQTQKTMGDVAKKARQKLYDVVVDINRIKNVTGNIKLFGKQKTSQGPAGGVEMSESGIEHKDRKSFIEEFNPDILFDIFKDDELINEEQIKTIMNKILYYLENEVKKTDINRIELSEKDRKNERIMNINFNALTLNIVEMVKKMVYFECFTQNKSNSMVQKNFFGKRKMKDQAFDLENDLFRLIKALINIISVEKKQEEEDKVNVKRASGGSPRSPRMVVGSLNSQTKIPNDPKSPQRKPELILIDDDFNKILTNSIKKKFVRTLDNSKGSDQETTIDVKVKMEIIKVLLFLMDLRHDDFINIIIDFINSSIEDMFKTQRVYSELLIQKAIHTDIQGYLPSVFSNGLNTKYPEVRLNYNSLANHNLDKITDGPLLPTLFYIFQFSHDYSLNYLVLQLIFEMFSQRERLIRSMKHVHLIINPTDQLLFEYLKTRSLHLRFIAEQSEVWLVPPGKLDDPGFKYKFVIYQVRDLLMELISFFYNSFNMNENHEVGFYERMCNEMNDEDINKSRQTMIKDLAIHTIVLTLVKDGTYILEYIDERNPQNEVIIQLFESCYRFLLIFVKNEHKSNKKGLISEIDFFISSMDTYEVGQSELLCEIFKNNYKLSLRLTDDLLTVFFKKLSIKTKSNYGHDPKYLKFFENIMFDKREPIMVNIHKLINFIFDSNRKFEFLCMIENPFYKKQRNQLNDDEGEPDARSMWGHHIFDFTKEKTQHPYLYQSKALDILVNCLKNCEDKQLLKLIIQKTFNLNYIFKLLSTDDIYFGDSDLNVLHSVLKNPLYRLIELVWLDSGKPSPELNNNKGLIKFVKKQQDILKIIERHDIDEIKRGRKSTVKNKLTTIRSMKSEDYESDDDDEDLDDEDILIEEGSLNKELELNEKYINQQIINQTVANNLRGQHSFDFIANLFENVLPLIIGLVKKLIINERNIEIEDRSDLTSLYEYGKSFANFVKANLTITEIKKYKNITLLDEFEKYFNVTLEYNNIYNNQEENEKETEEVNDWNLNIGTYHLLNEELPLGNILPDKRKDPVNFSKDHAWRVYLLNLLINPEMKSKHIFLERKALIDAIKKIADLEYSDIVKEYIQKKHQKMSMEMFIKKLVSFFKVWAEESSTVKDKVILSLIDLLQDLIESNESEDEKLKIQNLMNKCGLTETIFSYFCLENISQKVFENLIYLSISLLEGGNSQVQETIFNYFTKNSSSENFFSNLYKIINEQINFRNKKKSHYEKVDLCFKELSYSYKTKSKFGIEKILRLLQLFTENHNSSLQNYLRYQTNSRNNYDILGMTVKILESCLLELNEHNYKMASQSFDTLTEFIQGPCEANQLALVETPFANIASRLLEVDDSITQSKKQIKKKNKIMQLLRRKKKITEKHRNEIMKFQSCSSETMQMSVNLISTSQQNEIESQKILVKYLHSLSPTFAKEIEASFERHSPLGFQNWMLTGLKHKCVIAIESLCEGQRNNDILRKIMKNLSLDVLKDNLGWIYQKKQRYYGEKYTWDVYNDSDKKLETKGFILATGFKIFIILRKYLELAKMEDSDEDYEEMQLLKKEFSEVFASENIVTQLGHFGIDLIKAGVTTVEKISEITRFSKLMERQASDSKEIDEDTQKKLNKDGLLFFSKHTASIEINRNKFLYKQYFPKLPPCFYLEKDLKKWFLANVNRTTLHSKVSSLVFLSEEFIESLKINTAIKDLAGKNFILLLISKHLKLWKDLSFLLCIMQNLIILGWSEIILQDSHNFPFEFIISSHRENVQTALFLMELQQIGFSGLVWLFSISKRMPLVIKKAQKHIVVLENEENREVEASELQVNKSTYLLFLRGLNKVMIYLKFTILDYYIMYDMIYTTLAILGLFNPLFIAALLFDIFIRFPLLLYVVKSLWRPKYQIFLTMALFIIIQYYFALAAYYIFYDSFQDYCEDLYQCFSLILDQTFKTNSGIGSFFPPFQEQYVGWTLSWRSIYDFINTFIILNLIIEIIAGIIIDTFAVLRQEMEEKNNDIQNFCFICGIEKQTLDKKTEERRGFAYHIEMEHNMWNYIYYILYLRYKERTEYSGFESYVSLKLESDDISWFPLNKALSLTNKNLDNEDDAEMSEEDNSEINEEKNRTYKDLVKKLENLEKQMDQFESVLEKSVKTNIKQK